MKKSEPQFDVARVSWMRMPYPSNGTLKMEIIKREAQLFEEKVRRDLCGIRALNAGKN